MKHRNDIDGLRAIAVSSVIVYHLDANKIPGGFLGVDIFFVISGFLITGIIYDALKERNFSYAGFYDRRIRRLYPALLSTLAFSCIAASILYDPERMRDFGGSALHALFGLSNFFFNANSNYFAVESQFRPLLHTWSLAVEEQFYVLWPLLLFVIVRVPVLARVLILIAVIIASTLIGEHQLATAPQAAFYLLPARVAELSIGGLAIILHREYRWNEKLPNGIAVGLHLAALGAIVATLFLYNEAMPFPGWRALPPCLATAVLLLFPISGPVSVLLNNWPMRWVGLISYSAYLIHWPVIVFYHAYRLKDLGPLSQALVIVVTLVAASLSYLFVEKPFRSQGGRKARVSDPALAFTMAISVMAIALFTAHAWSGQDWVRIAKRGVIERIARNKDMSGEMRRKESERDACYQLKGSTRTDFSSCLQIVPGKTNVIVFGSSYAADDWLMLRTAYPEANISKITAIACPSFLPMEKHCALTHDFIFANIDKINRFDAVILSHDWKNSDNYGEMTRLLKALTTKRVILGPRGNLTVSEIDIVRKDAANLPRFIDQKYWNPNIPEMRRKMADMAQANGAGFVDMFKILRRSGGLPAFASPENLMFSDEGHYTAEGAAAVAKDMKATYPTVDQMVAASLRDKPSIP